MEKAMKLSYLVVPIALMGMVAVCVLMPTTTLEDKVVDARDMQVRRIECALNHNGQGRTDTEKCGIEEK